MGTFRGFDKKDITFFEKIPDKNQVAYYTNNKEQAKHIDDEFVALAKDVDIALKIEFNSKYKWGAKRLSQGFGREFDSIWGAFHTDKRKRQDDVQLFMNFGLFQGNTPTFNVGMSLHHLDEETYEIYGNNLKSTLDRLKKTLENSKNKYNLEDDEGNVIAGSIIERVKQWIESPGSIYISFDEEAILNTNFVEKVKSIMRDLYPIFDLLITEENQPTFDKLAQEKQEVSN